MEKLKNVLAKIAEKTNNIKALQYIQKSLAMMLPVTLVGSLFSLLTGFPFEPWTNFINSTGLADAFNLVYNSTYGYMSLILAFCMAYQYAVANKQRKNALACGIMAVCCFLISCGNNSATYIGTMGMLGAFVVGGLVGWCFKKLIEADITIKLPEGVPPMVSQSFVALIPSLTVCLVFMILNFVLGLTGLGTVQDIIYNLVRVPLTTVGANGVGEFILVVYCTMLWFFGIHGGMIMMPIIMVIFMEKTMGNLAAYTATKHVHRNSITGRRLCDQPGDHPVLSQRRIKADRQDRSGSVSVQHFRTYQLRCSSNYESKLLLTISARTGYRLGSYSRCPVDWLLRLQ